MSLSVTVAGGGVFGLACAVTLARRGARVLSLDPDPEAATASAVAAGMLAPVGETLFDESVAAHHDLLTQALGFWPEFAARAGIGLANDGLVVPRYMSGRLAAQGVGARPHALGVFAPVDPRVIEPAAALRALRVRARDLGVAFEARAHTPEDHERGVLVIATGPGARSAKAAPEAVHLRPVKGQIAVLPQGPAAGPVIRWAGGYLAPQPGGARVGATMEPGRSDTGVEPETIVRLVEAARQRLPDLDPQGAYGQAGVRMQTPDGLPLVGPSRTPGVLLALGAHRNGWLLAPLVASMIAAYCKGDDPGPWAGALRPGRFDG
jgi:glycine oxidase